MNIYPDTSFFVALRFLEDLHHVPAVRYYEQRQDDNLLWSPWHRVEVANTVRQLARGAEAALIPADARRIIRQIETDVRLSYFLHMEADWRDVLRSAYEISAERGFALRCRSADLLHVAYAIELSADLFVSFDEDQLALAEAAGLNVQQPN